MKVKWIRSLPILTTILVAGCAMTGRDLVRDNTVQIEKVSSGWATVRFVSVIQEDGEIELRGEAPAGRPGSHPGPYRF
jgi:hypothetical protein